MSNSIHDNAVMTTRELADYLKLNEKTVIKMAQTGKLPGVKIGSQWRFYLATINAYLQNALVRSSDEEIDSVVELGTDIVPLSRLTGLDYIHLDISSKTANEVLSEAAKLSMATGVCSSREVFLYELKKREEMLSTAIGGGIALPHPRHPSADLFAESKILILRSRRGIDFKAPDDKLVYLFFVICAHNEAVHIRLLAKIAKLFHQKNIVEKFMSSQSKKEIVQLLLAYERDLLFLARQETMPEESR